MRITRFELSSCSMGPRATYTPIIRSTLPLRRRRLPTLLILRSEVCLRSIDRRSRGTTLRDLKSLLMSRVPHLHFLFSRLWRISLIKLIVLRRIHDARFANRLLILAILHYFGVVLCPCRHAIFLISVALPADRSGRGPLRRLSWRLSWFRVVSYQSGGSRFARCRVGRSSDFHTPLQIRLSRCSLRVT